MTNAAALTAVAAVAAQARARGDRRVEVDAKLLILAMAGLADQHRPAAGSWTTWGFAEDRHLPALYFDEVLVAFGR